MEKRILLASFLSLAILLTFRGFLPEPQPQPETVQAPSPLAGGEPSAATPAAPPQPTAPVPVAPPTQLVDSSPIASTEETTVIVDTPAFSAALSNVGGVLTSYKLKSYKDKEGQPIELIDQGVSSPGRPFQIALGDDATDRQVQSAKFAVDDSDKLRPVFRYSANGLAVEKRFAFRSDSYRLTFEAAVTRQGQSIPFKLVWAGGFGDQSVAFDATALNVVHLEGGSFVRTALSGLEPGGFVSDRFGLEDRYFIAMLLGQRPLSVATVPEESKDSSGTAFKVVRWSGDLTGPVDFYIGPKRESDLDRADAGLSRVIDFGFFEVITKPLMGALQWIHQYVGNYGWSIVLLTVLINLALFPLKLKQQLSMTKLQKVQPQMKALQDKYRKLKPTDPKRQQVQKEMMDFYREQGVNPMGGCLPLLLQMPFFFAFWSMLSVAIDLRQSPWMLWIRDLSQHDPYYVLPVLMAASMMVMQKMTPTTMDPVQAKVMMLMPIMMMVMFLWVQSGLVLYWLTGNLVAIGQQWLIAKYWLPVPKAKAVRNE